MRNQLQGWLIELFTPETGRSCASRYQLNMPYYFRLKTWTDPDPKCVLFTITFYLLIDIETDDGRSP